MSEEKPQNPHSSDPGPVVPGKPRKRTSPRAMAVFPVLWLVIAVGWLIPVLWSFFQGDRDYFRLVFGVLYLGIAAVYFVLWRRARTVPANGARDTGPRI